MAPRRPRAAGSGMSFAFGASLLVIVGILVLGFFASTREDGGERTPGAARAAESAGSPFDDLPVEEPPPPRAPRGSGSFVAAPADLEAAPIWTTALGEAEQAQGWLAQASEARAAENHAEYQRCAKEAKRLLDAAFEATALWEAQLVERHGERDPIVRRILRTRDDWRQKLVVLRKTTSR